MRHEGLHMEWSHFLELAILKDNYTNDLNEWFNTKYDLMAWDGEYSKERLRGTKQGWRASDGLVAEVLAFSWGTNQAMMATFMWRIKSLLECLMEVTWYICDYSNLMNGIKSHAQDGYAQVKRSISTCWHPHLMKIGIHGFSWKRSTQKV